MKRYILSTRLSRPLSILLASLFTMFSLTGCQNDALFAPQNGSGWLVADTTYHEMTFRQLSSTPNTINSLTLYAGPIDGDAGREAIMLMKPGIVDSFEIANLISADLILFRRTFMDSTPDLLLVFEMGIMAADSGYWVETDSGLSVTDAAFQITSGVQSSMITDSIDIPLGDTTITINDIEHIIFPLSANNLSDWLNLDVERNGVIIKQIGGADAIAFNSRYSSIEAPLLRFTYMDTTNGGEIKTEYSGMVSTMSLYPESGIPTPADASLMTLDFSEGWSFHLDFSDAVMPDSSRKIIAARMLFNSPKIESEFLADRMLIKLSRRLTPISEGDSMVTVYAGVTNHFDESNWAFSLGSIMNDMNSNRIDNYGFDFSISPQNNDFDTQQFYSPTAADALLRPALEIIYSQSHVGGE